MSIVVRILSLGWVTMMMIMSITNVGDGAISQNLMEKINIINNEGPYLGVVANSNLLRNSRPPIPSSSSVPHPTIPYLEFAGRRFSIQSLSNQKIIFVLSGVGMLNAGITTQLLINIFNIEGVIQYGLSGSTADPQLQIGDVIVPHYWAHSGLWYWQRHGDGSRDELAFESIGDFTRKIGYLNISEYETNPNYSDNLLNNLWYQPEEIYSVDREPDNRQHAFWVPVDEFYFSVAQQLEGASVFFRCVESFCLPRSPRLVRVERGMSANVFVDNVAYGEFLHSEFNATLLDMESAAVALACFQQKTPFIAINTISDFAGDASSLQGSVFSSIVQSNAILALGLFASRLPAQVQTLNSDQ